jgi:cytochrome c peroxidase
MKPKFWFALTAALAIATSCCAAATTAVDQRGLAFSVAALTIAKGTIIQFNNHDETAHNILIRADGGGITDGGLQQPGQTLRAPFMKAGVYHVTCGIHPRMKLTVTVK